MTEGFAGFRFAVRDFAGGYALKRRRRYLYLRRRVFDFETAGVMLLRRSAFDLLFLFRFFSFSLGQPTDWSEMLFVGKGREGGRVILLRQQRGGGPSFFRCTARGTRVRASSPIFGQNDWTSGRGEKR